MASARMAGAAVCANSSGVVLIWLTGDLSGGALRAENGRREKLLQAMCPVADGARTARGEERRAGVRGLAIRRVRCSRARNFQEKSVERPSDAEASSAKKPRESYCQTRS